MDWTYSQSVLAWCANCQWRDTSVSTGSWKKKEVWIWTQHLKLIFPTAYINCDTIFTGNSAGLQTSAIWCLYKAKTWGKSQETILNTFGIGQVLFHLQSKKKCIRFFRVLFLFRAGWQFVFESKPPCCQTNTFTAPGLTGLVGYWCDALRVYRNDIIPNQEVFFKS